MSFLYHYDTYCAQKGFWREFTLALAVSIMNQDTKMLHLPLYQRLAALTPEQLAILFAMSRAHHFRSEYYSNTIWFDHWIFTTCIQAFKLHDNDHPSSGMITDPQFTNMKLEFRRQPVEVEYMSMYNYFGYYGRQIKLYELESARIRRALQMPETGYSGPSFLLMHPKRDIENPTPPVVATPAMFGAKPVRRKRNKYHKR